MPPPNEAPQKAALTDYLAAERTFLAWIRTGLALMGFGFVVARFGLFLSELRIAERASTPQSFGVSLWFGTGLILAGVVMNVFAGWQQLRLLRQLDRGAKGQSTSAAAPALITVFLVVVGLAMTYYLISIRQSSKASSGITKENFMDSLNATGITDVPSTHSVDETVEKLKAILQAKGVTLFALVDHSGEAEKAGLKMPPTKLLIFGNPKGGTPVMLAAPSAAIDLPLKILVWQSADGKTWMSYNSPEYLQHRHAIPAPLLQNISVAAALIAKVNE